jgi:AraC-like DNA-binding protein/mannose-6-phosphate isomerase-like protein (cupin superfamily)
MVAITYTRIIGNSNETVFTKKRRCFKILRQGGVFMNTEGFETGSAFLSEMLTKCQSSNLSFRIYYWGWRDPHYNNNVHKHSFYEVCYVVSGEGEYQDEDTVYQLRSGSLFVSRPGIWHQIRSTTGLGLIFVAYELEKEQCREEEFALYSANLDTGPICMEVDNSVIHYWLGLYKHAGSRPYGELQELHTVAGILLAGLLRPFVKDDSNRSQNVAKPSSESRSAILHLSKQYIRDNLSSPLKIEEVAEYMNLSTRQLSRLFQLDGGDTFLTYLRNERLKHAEMMLKTSIFSLKEIAAYSGFQSVHYFTNVFTEQKGMPPGEYRKQFLDVK